MGRLPVNDKIIRFWELLEKSIQDAKKRPERDTIISQDEITNLKIELGKVQDVNDFIEEI